MTALRRVLLFAGLLSLSAGLSGCESFRHNLQPHRLHRLNRGEGMPSGVDAYSHRPKPAAASVERIG